MYTPGDINLKGGNYSRGKNTHTHTNGEKDKTKVLILHLGNLGEGYWEFFVLFLKFLCKSETIPRQKNKIKNKVEIKTF